MASPLPPGTDLCAVPAAAPPAGTEPQLGAAPPLAPAMIAVSALMTAWSTVFTVGRLYNNARKLRIADYFVLVALVLNITYTGLVLSLVRYGRHQWDTPACWFNSWFMIILFIQGMLLGPVIFFAKGAILLLYRQIFTIDRPMQIAIYTGLVILFLTYWPSVPLEAIFAAPRAGQSWDTLLTNGEPVKLIYWGLVQGPLAVAIDIYIFILPFPRLLTLHLSVRKRIGLFAIFLTALMGVVASVIALVFRVKLLWRTDSTCIVENNVALIISSTPGFVHLVKQKLMGGPPLRSRLSGKTLAADDAGTGAAGRELHKKPDSIHEARAEGVELAGSASKTERQWGEEEEEEGEEEKEEGEGIAGADEGLGSERV